MLDAVIGRGGPPKPTRSWMIANWLATIARMQRIQCASIAVRRDVYERLGGYRSDLKMALDWEMWVRIAASYPVWFEPQPLACWRVHDENESSRLGREGADVPDMHRAVAIIEDYLPASYRGTVGRSMLMEYRDEAIWQVNRRMQAGDWRAGLEHYARACECDPTLRHGRPRRDFWKWVVKLRLRESLFGPKPRGEAAANS